MDSATRQLVRTRAANRCEYCGLLQEHSPLASLQVEHIVPKKHGGNDDLQNLALACIDCNLSKGSKLTGIDPETSKVTELFNPRTQPWEDQFQWQGVEIVGITPTGRATVRVLNMNSEEQLQLRTVHRQP